MISQDSVLTTSNYFVTIDKINSPQQVKSLSGGNTLLQKISDAVSLGFYVETTNFDIYVSPYQKFVVRDENSKTVMHSKLVTAEDLKDGMEVLTYFGWEPIKFLHFFSAPKEMSNIVTKSKFFLANGFYLVSD